MTLRAILFDHDGTLVDSEPTHHRLWAQVLSNYGVSLSREQYRLHYAGVPTPANARDVVRRFALPDSPETLAAAKNEATRAYLKSEPFPMMPGALRAIAALHGLGLKLAVVTGAGSEGVKATLAAHQLEKCFSAIVSGDDVRNSKRAPDCYLLALDRLGLRAEECLALEDTEHGVAAAVGAGIRCLALPSPMSSHHDFSRATAVLGGMDESVEYVQRLLGKSPRSVEFASRA